MTLTMETNATISHWKATDGTDIFFPEATISVAGEEKLRGGAPVCAPNFGPAPTGGPYKGIHLPNHGLVRLCTLEEGKSNHGNPCFHQELPKFGEDGWMHAGFIFNVPWTCEVWVGAKADKPVMGMHRLRHRISLIPEVIHDFDMPYSLGFHPYLATGGSQFILNCGDEVWNGADLTVGEAFFVPANGQAMTLKTADRTVIVQALQGYNGYYIWSDAPDKYICIEPVCIDEDRQYNMLYSGESITCECNVTYAPTP